MKLRGCLIAATLLALGACRVEREPNFDYAPMLNHMMFSQAAETNTKSKVFSDGLTMQAPPAGTIARFDGPQFVPTAEAKALPYAFTNTDDSIAEADAAFKGAVPVEATPAVLERGAAQFGRFCAPCHGAAGGGDGLVGKRAAQFGGWNLDDCGKVAKDLRQADGKFPATRIFHKITWGADPSGPNATVRENMPAYASQISQEDRWAIVLHVKSLQDKAGKACPQ